ncbi:PspC domain-containing protein [Kribbella sp. VKM Ac-2568]|uniref:PspC domain-containing protein n=1 Tax=Kribbella sp. VKM Ac-2568 TaxID=2512219 RepID=UPI0010444B7E|nr:PspC domain-containing protein [Kribbella sp. VKM Ac-2568]TCM46737.1 phage shock protein C (PspC) family protein [Kribbella sp. VKM Ac-2568]
MEQNSSGGFDRDQLKDVQSWRRSRSDRMLAGVCGGIGRALNIDPVLVRVVMAVLVISGPGLFFYVAAWVLMPDEGSDRSAAQGLLGDRIRPDHPWLWPVVIGICVFVAIAMMSSFNFGRIIPGPLVVLGLLWLLVFRRKGRKQHWSHRGGHWTGGNGTTPADPSATGATTPGAFNPGSAAPGSGVQDSAPQGSAAPQYSAAAQSGPSAPPAGLSSSAAQRPQDRVTAPVQPVWTEDDPLGLYVDEPPATATRTKAEPPVKGLRGVKPAIVALTGVAIAIAWAAGAGTSMMLVIGLATLGLGMLVGGFLGRTLALLPLGILLAIGVAVSTVFPNMPRDFADVNFVAAPGTTITATSTAYTFDAGSVHLDLTKATFAPGAKVVVNGGVGEVVVKVPPDVDVNANLSAEAGELITFGQQKGGHNADVQLTDLGADAKKGPQSVNVDVHLKLGSITVERG